MRIEKVHGDLPGGTEVGAVIKDKLSRLDFRV